MRPGAALSPEIVNLEIDQAQADLQPLVNLAHCRGIETTHSFDQALPVNRANLA